MTLFRTNVHSKKLTSFGIHDNILKWIEWIYLAENNKLYLMVISLAPLLLLVVFPGVLCWALTIYNVNEMPSVVSSPVLMFAEDMKIFHVIRNGDDNTILENDLDLLYRWSQQW